MTPRAGTLPPVVIAELLKASQGFNPEKEFPTGSFPRPWPFVGGHLGPAPPTPPTRQLIYEGLDEPTIVSRGEVPTVHVPEAHAQPSRRPARDPP